MDVRFPEQFVRGAESLGLRKLLLKLPHLRRIGIVNVSAFAPGFGQPLRLAVDVPVIEGQCREDKLPWLYNRCRFPHRRIIHPIGFLMRHVAADNGAGGEVSLRNGEV
jgi:hypothetical protein